MKRSLPLGRFFVLLAFVASLFGIKVEEAQAMDTFAAYEQIHYRFRDDDGSETAATWSAAENTAITGQDKESNFRIRIKTQANNHDQGETIARKLQYKDATSDTTCSAGSWTDITTTVGSNDFVIALSTQFGPDVTATTEQLTSAGGKGFVAGELLESTQATAAVAVANNETEDEWNLQATTNATEGRRYAIRLIETDNTVYTTYTQCPLVTITAGAPTWTLNAYRWYVDPNVEDVIDAWGNLDIAQATALTTLPAGNDPPGPTQELRLRTNFTVATNNLNASSIYFKLQYKAGTDATCTTGSWTDVGAGGGVIWRYATSDITDGTTISTSRLSAASDVLESYVKANPSVINPNSAIIGEEIEYDFHIEQNSAVDATQYSFRVVETDNTGTPTTVFATYTACPTLTTEPGTDNLMRHGNFFADEVELGMFWAEGSTASIPYWQDGESVGNLTSTADWQEISGITNPTVSANSSYIWMQSDGSVDKIFAVSTSDASDQGEWTLSGVNGVDYEDISSATVGSDNFIYLADIGDNGNSRTTFTIFRIKEPTVTGSNGTIISGDIEEITCDYPSGDLPSHKDAETLIVDPDTGDMYVITKRETAPGVYKLAHASSYSGTQTLTFEGDMFDIPDVSSVAATGNAVGGNISPNGEEILIKSYDLVYHFPRRDRNDTIITTLQQTPSTVDGYVGGGSASPKKSHPSAEPQGEAITFDYNGDDYYTMSEFVTAEGSTSARFPFFRHTRLTSIPTTITFQEDLLPTTGYVGTEDTYIWDTNPDTNNGTAVTFIADRATGVETDQRKGLIKFDITDIPSTATIVGAQLDLYIAVEGQGWKAHRILTANWTESSTYNSLTGGVDDDGTEASTVEDVRNGVNLDTVVDVTVRNNMRLDTVQAWRDGSQANYGWLIEATHDSDGQQYSSSDEPVNAEHPALTIRYVP